ncbi:unnamed protein product [Allacma fusca]|uniref:Uncharacterized protein n=1 Tax=Allacma fusca TaxID=39272 RepID=A0A8J2LV18_9HEXA|nr:unnamed protein product [Allacma fusca]
MLTFLVTGVAAAGFFLITRSKQMSYDFEIPEEHLEGLKTVPKILALGRLYIFMGDLLIITAFTFAFVFILIFGCILVLVQYHVCLVLLKEFQKLDIVEVSYVDTVLAPVEYIDKRIQNEMPECPDFPRLFQNMKYLFEIYGVIGGWYVIGISFFAVTEIINNWSSFINKGFELDEYFQTIIEGVVLILILATFGEFLQVEIEKSIEKIADAMGTIKCKNENHFQKLLLWSDWFLQWKWRPNARHLFEVNHTMIPAAIGTVLTYFIFMFQLRTSEIEGKKIPSNTTLQ